MTRLIILGASLSLALGLLGCEDEELASDYADYERLDIMVCAPAAGPFTLEIDNDFMPLPVGLVAELAGNDEGTSIRVRITVLDETEEVAGVTTRVVEEAEWENDRLVEISRNFFAQAPDGTVCYFGEDVDIYNSAGEVESHGGAWRAGVDDAEPGIIMPGTPTVGTAFAQERAPRVAEDMSAITAAGRAVSTPAGDFTDTLRCFDWNPIEGEEGDVKYYARGVGLIVDEEARLVSFTDPS